MFSLDLAYFNLGFITVTSPEPESIQEIPGLSAHVVLCLVLNNSVLQFVSMC